MTPRTRPRSRRSLAVRLSALLATVALFTLGVGVTAAQAADPPVIDGLFTIEGPTTGGTVVAILGSGFTDASAVHFGADSATSFTVESDIEVDAVAPAGTGTVHITVTTPVGTSGMSALDEFTYVPKPVITSVSPASGSTAGGTTVTITGSGFDFADTVSFGGQSASFTEVNDSDITATSPPGTGVVDVSIASDASQTSTNSPADQFTYIAPPTIATMSPAHGSAAGGTVLTITGTGFTGATSVTFAGTPATSFTVNSDTSLTVTVPPGTAGGANLTITAASGLTVSTIFTYDPAASNELPKTGVDPTSGLAAASLLLLLGAAALLLRRFGRRRVGRIQP